MADSLKVGQAMRDLAKNPGYLYRSAPWQWNGDWRCKAYTCRDDLCLAIHSAGWDPQVVKGRLVVGWLLLHLQQLGLVVCEPGDKAVCMTNGTLALDVLGAVTKLQHDPRAVDLLRERQKTIEALNGP